MKLLDEGLKQICAADKTAACLIENRYEQITGALQLYINEIERFNTAYGLVKTDNRDTLIVKHILDSLVPLGHIANFLEAKDKTVKALADAGSGAGLPGIPLAICLPTVQVSLIERMGRRAGFLRNTCAVLSSAFPGLELSRITVEEIELEKAFPLQFDCLVLRALSALDDAFVAKLIKLLAQDGTIAAYKGKQTTAQAELDSLSGCTAELIPLTVPFLDEERCLAMIRP
ncbi:MAG: 16S rRNA (guanine(527)-N(7))-methyltransferase RsmG [Treponema sp.]|nr:16S rRNA (guanine(527)-N(7))-methyltransferase RsmG [Treponema sp.]